MKSFKFRLVFPLFLGLALTLLLAWFQGYRVNVTPSLPEGVYRITDKPLERGDLAFFCLEQNNPFAELARERGYLGPGDCPSGLRPLGKQVMGLPGDRIEIRYGHLFLNDRELAEIRVAAVDSRKRPLSPSLLKSAPIPAGQVLMLTEGHPGSFDSRYFGLVPLDSATPVRVVFTF